MPNQIPEDELIEELQRLADDLGETPTAADMDDNGAYSHGTYVTRFGTWNQAVETAGLTPNTGRGDHVSDEALLDDLKHVAETVERTPTIGDMETHGYHNPSTLISRFDSWSDSLEAADFDAHHQGTKISDEDLLDELQRLADELGHPPTTAEMDEHGKYSQVTYVHRFDGWNNALETAGLESRGEGPEIKRDVLLDDLRRVAETIDGYMTMNEYGEHGRFDPDTYRRRFGSWLDALEEAGLPSTPKRDRGPQYSDDELLDDLRDLADELGRTPTFADMNDHGPRSATTFTNRFGTWNNAVEEAGLEPNR